MHTVVVVLPLLAAFFLLWVPQIIRAQDEKENDDKNGAYNDYEIYQTLDSIQKHFHVASFYELLGVPETASDEAVGRAARTLSFRFHPDKQQNAKSDKERATAEQKYKLVMYAAGLLRSDQGKERYRWLMNEAPAWHRHSVYVRRAIVKSAARLTLTQVALLTLVFGTGCQLFVHWAAFLKAVYLKWWGIREARRMGDKEIKRIRRRLETGGDVGFLCANNESYLAVSLIDTPTPTLPSPLKLFIFKVPLTIATLPFKWLLKSKCD